MSSIESTVPEAGRKPVRRAPMRGDRVEKEKARLDSLKLIPNIDRKTLCTQVLEMGFIQSYTDLFYLTHRPDPSSENGACMEMEMKEMINVRDNLTAAEFARRTGDTKTVYDCYCRLAAYFETQDDFSTGIFFRQKCLEVSRLTMDKKREMNVLRELGIAHCKEERYDESGEYHESQLALACAAGSQQDIIDANVQLNVVYQKMAEKSNEKGDKPTALELYSRCLSTARATKDALKIGWAQYQMGKMHLQLHRASEALSFLQNYLKSCEEQKDMEGQVRALSSLAAAFQQKEDTSSAVTIFQQLLDIATKTENMSAQSEACCGLGIIYNDRRDFQKAVSMFEKNYAITRNMVNTFVCKRSKLDLARIYLGMSRGNQNMPKFMETVNHDTTALLAWKVSRVQ